MALLCKEGIANFETPRSNDNYKLYTMIKHKQLHSIRDAYAAPECVSIEVKPDALICQSEEISALDIDDALLEDWGTLI